MRCNQVSINIERFGKYVPKDYPETVQRIHVYCDDYESIYAALSKAYALVISELAEHEKVGARTDVYTNEFAKSNYREMHGTIPIIKRKYEDDVNLQYYDTDKVLCEDRIWIYENARDILETILECEDSVMVEVKLKDNFGLNDYQIRKLSQIRLDMLNKEAYIEAKGRIENLSTIISNKDNYKHYQKREIQKLTKEIERIKAYLILVDHCEEFMQLVVKTEALNDVEKMLCERYGFTRELAAEFKYYGINEFSVKMQNRKKQERIRLEERLAYYNQSLENWEG